MKAILLTSLLFVLTSCGGGSDSTESPDSQSTSSTSSQETNAQCIFTPGQSGWVNLGEYTGEPAQEEEVSRLKEYFIASCTGDVSITVDSHDTAESYNQESNE